MEKLIYKNKTILKEMKYATSIFEISYGLMFASKKKIERGICLVMPIAKNLKFQSAVTMLFCFHSMNILFLDEKFKVVDNVNLKPFKFSYIPKKSSKYVIESTKDKFKNIKIGDRVKIA